MSVLTMILLSVGLAMDCFAVSFSKGMICKDYHGRWYPLLMAFLFGLFQGGMPLIGYYAGTLFTDFFTRWSGLIALVLLSVIGGKMLWESFSEEEHQTGDWHLTELLLLAVATSIDALSTGVIFIPIPNVVWTAVSIIAAGSLIFSLAGYVIGKTAGSRFRFNATRLGGIILILIGVKIFLGF